jgi:hypothetical protein
VCDPAATLLVPQGGRMQRFRHRVAHLLGCNRRTTEILYLNDVPVAGFRCAGCGELSSARPLQRGALPTRKGWRRRLRF